MLEAPELDTLLQVGSHQSGVQDKKMKDKFITLHHSLCYLLYEDGTSERQIQCQKNSDKGMLNSIDGIITLIHQQFLLFVYIVHLSLNLCLCKAMPEK